MPCSGTAKSRSRGAAKEVQALLEQRAPYKEIREKTGVSNGTISYHARRLGLTIKAGNRSWSTKIDWPAVQAYYDQGYTAGACAEQFSFSKQAWTQAVRRGRIVSREPMRPIEDLLVCGRPSARGNIKRRLLLDGTLRNECYICGQGPTWNGEPLVMVLDHINGVKLDWSIYNLRMLCPNCNSQTPTFCGRNTRKTKQSPLIA